MSKRRDIVDQNGVKFELPQITSFKDTLENIHKNSISKAVREHAEILRNIGKNLRKPSFRIDQKNFEFNEQIADALKKILQPNQELLKSIAKAAEAAIIFNDSLSVLEML